MDKNNQIGIRYISPNKIERNDNSYLDYYDLKKELTGYQYELDELPNKKETKINLSYNNNLDLINNKMNYNLNRDSIFKNIIKEVENRYIKINKKETEKEKKIEENENEILSLILKNDNYQKIKEDFKKYYIYKTIKDRDEDNNKKNFGLNFYQIIILILCPSKCIENRKEIFRYKHLLNLVDEKIEKYLDYFNTMNLIEEMNLLKRLIMNEEQIKLFKYIQNPILEFDIETELDLLNHETNKKVELRRKNGFSFDISQKSRKIINNKSILKKIIDQYFKNNKILIDQELAECIENVYEKKNYENSEKFFKQEIKINTKLLEMLEEI